MVNGVMLFAVRLRVMTADSPPACFPSALQFSLLAKQAGALSSAVTSGPAMSAKQAQEIVSMRTAVDSELNNLSHTCLDGECGGK